MAAGTPTEKWSCPSCGHEMEAAAGPRVPRCHEPGCVIYGSIIPGGAEFPTGTPMERAEG